jgi:hypothetical protein
MQAHRRTQCIVEAGRHRARERVGHFHGIPDWHDIGTTGDTNVARWLRSDASTTHEPTVAWTPVGGAGFSTSGRPDLDGSSKAVY